MSSIKASGLIRNECIIIIIIITIIRLHDLLVIR